MTIVCSQWSSYSSCAVTQSSKQSTISELVRSATPNEKAHKAPNLDSCQRLFTE